MIIEKIGTGKTLEEAVSAAKKMLNAPAEATVETKVLETGKKGFLGLGAKDYKVSVSYDDGKKPQSPKREQKKPAPKPAQKKKPAPKKPVEPKQEAPANCLPGALLSLSLFASLTLCTTSNSLALPGIPYAFRDGDTARQMVFSVRSASATTRLVVSGSSCRSTHSTEA